MKSSPSRMLLVFLKEPIAGRVKTRLAADVGPEEAVRRYRAMVAVLLKQLRGLRDCRVRFCYAPDDADEAVRFWLLPQMEGIAAEGKGTFSWQHCEGGLDFVAQGEGDLGERMERQFERAFAEGYEKVAVIGTDCVAMGSGWINAAFTQLRAESDLVIGPSADGGYVFLALGEMDECYFRDMEWSVATVCQETCDRAKAAGRTVRRLPELEDVDDLEGWARLVAGPQGGAVNKALKAQP